MIPMLARYNLSLTLRTIFTPSMSVYTIPTTCPENIQPLLTWLKSHGADGLGGDSICLKDSPGKGLGVFAARDFSAGDVVFILPRKCIFGIGDALKSTYVQFIKNQAPILQKYTWTDELYMWIAMSEQRNDPSSHFSPYLRSLDDKILPSIHFWDSKLLKALEGTNIESSLRKASNRFAEYESMLCEVNDLINSQSESSLKRPRLDPSIIPTPVDADQVAWARSHYMSRRYVPRLAFSYDKDYVPNKQEDDLGNLGTMCPLLDILNHHPDKEWLELKVDGEFLKVITNFNIKRGEEIFYNYGSLPNEMLLYGYAYCIPNNKDEGVAVKLMAGQNQWTGTRHLGTFYIRRGGFDGIPKELWKAISKMLCDDEDIGQSNDETSLEVDIDACNMLAQWVAAKLKNLQISDSRTRDILVEYGVGTAQPDIRASFIDIYRRGQVEILAETVSALQEIIDSVDASESESDED